MTAGHVVPVVEGSNSSWATHFLQEPQQNVNFPVTELLFLTEIRYLPSGSFPILPI